MKARIEDFRLVGSEPKQLIFDAQALTVYAEGRGVTAVVDVGHARTLVALCQGGHLIGARALAVAGAAFTESIASATGMSIADAEALKHTLAVPDPGTVEWDDRTDAGVQRSEGQSPEVALGDAVDQWAAELRVELIALEDESELGVDEIVLVGGSARMPGLALRAGARVGVPTRPAVMPGGYGPECALVLGLARVAAGETKATDLRVGDFAYHGHADMLWNFFAASSVGSLVALIAAVALLTVQYTDSQGRLTELDGKIRDVVTSTFPDVSADKLTTPSMAMGIMQEKVAATAARVDALGSTVSGVPPTLDLLRQISEHVPGPSNARIDVRELNIGEGAVTMKAETDSYEMAAQIEESLKQEPRFKDAKKADEKKVGEALSFSLTIPLNAEEAAPTEGEAAGSEG